MKTKNRIWLCALIVMGLVLILTNSCKKDSKNPSTPITDIDGNVYTSVTIGTQVWMKENLKTTKYNNGDAIPTTTSDISSESAPKYQWAYNDNLSNVSTYGRLYTWYTIIDSRNVCPSGWHVPTDAELETLKSNLGGDTVAGGKLKETGTTHWQTPNTGATNKTGFTALPGGYRSLQGAYASINLSCWLWSSSDDSPLGWGQSIHYDDGVLLRGGFNKPAGVSVRCLKD